MLLRAMAWRGEHRGKGRVQGTITNTRGDFTLSVAQAPPFTLVFSFIGYTSQEIEITDASSTGLNVSLEESFMLGQRSSYLRFPCGRKHQITRYHRKGGLALFNKLLHLTF